MVFAQYGISCNSELVIFLLSKQLEKRRHIVAARNFKQFQAEAKPPQVSGHSAVNTARITSRLAGAIHAGWKGKQGFAHETPSGSAETQHHPLDNTTEF